MLIGSLSKSVCERRTSTGSGLFASLASGLVKTLGKILFIREKKLSNTNLLESRHIKGEKASLPVDVHRSKTSLLKLPNISIKNVIINRIHFNTKVDGRLISRRGYNWRYFLVNRSMGHNSGAGGL